MAATAPLTDEQLRSDLILWAALLLRGEMRPIPRGTAQVLPQDDLGDAEDGDDQDGDDDAPGPAPARLALPAPPQTPSPAKAEAGSMVSSVGRSGSSNRSSHVNIEARSATSSVGRSSSSTRSMADASSPNTPESLHEKIRETIRRLEGRTSSSSSLGSTSSLTNRSAASSSGCRVAADVGQNRNARIRTRPYPAWRPKKANTAVDDSKARHGNESEAHQGASPVSIPSSAITDADTTMVSPIPSPSKVFTQSCPTIDLCSDSEDEIITSRRVALSFYSVSQTRVFQTFLINCLTA
jgi:hypothetical protein